MKDLRKAIKDVLFTLSHTQLNHNGGVADDLEYLRQNIDSSRITVHDDGSIGIKEKEIKIFNHKGGPMITTVDSARNFIEEVITSTFQTGGLIKQGFVEVVFHTINFTFEVPKHFSDSVQPVDCDGICENCNEYNCPSDFEVSYVANLSKVIISKDDPYETKMH